MQINPYMVKPLGEPLLQPVINNITNRTNDAGTSISFFATLTPESTTNYTYTWSATGLPTGISIRASDGRISGNIDINLETQIYNVVVSVSVTNGTQTKTDTESFNWTVNKVIQGPANSRIFRNGYWDAYFGVNIYEDTVAKSGDTNSFQFNTGDLGQTSGNIINYWVNNWGGGGDGIANVIKNFEIGVGCTSIGTGAFAISCPLDFHFKGPIGIPESVVTIGQEAFQGKRNLCQNIADEELIIPSSVRSIGPRAFSGCTNIKKLTLKEGLRTIELEAFGNLTSVNQTLFRIPDSVTSLRFRSIQITGHRGDVYFGSGIGQGATNRPFIAATSVKNAYINCSTGAIEGQGLSFVDGFVYVSEQYYNQWNNLTDSVKKFIFYFQPLQLKLWTSFPDAMDGTWLRSDYD